MTLEAAGMAALDWIDIGPTLLALIVSFLAWGMGGWRDDAP